MVIENELQIAIDIVSLDRRQPLSDVIIDELDSEDRVIKTHISHAGNANFCYDTNSKSVLIRSQGYCERRFTTKELSDLSTVELLSAHPTAYSKNYTVSPGQHARICVHSPRPFRVRLFRLGATKEKVFETSELPAKIQNIPVGDVVAKGLDWNVNLPLEIPRSCRPGLFAFQVEDTDGKSYWGPLVVSNNEQAPRSSILVLASDPTWQAYNTWGGRSRYRNTQLNDKPVFEQGPVEYSPSAKTFSARLPKLISWPLRQLKAKLRERRHGKNWRNQRLSSQRPFTYLDLERTSPNKPFCGHLAGAEWTFLAWLEKSNYQYDYESTFALNGTSEHFEHYKVIVLNTHNEYWGQTMLRNLMKLSTKFGVSILAMGGNQVYRLIEVFDEHSLRFVIEFEKTLMDETKLLGTRYVEADYATCAPYEIIKPDHWLFEGAQLEQGHLFGETSLNCTMAPRYDHYDGGRPGLPSDGTLSGSGASGWETDKLGQHDHEFELLAKGRNQPQGADLVFRAKKGSRGATLNFSSICAPGSMDCEVISTMVSNFLNRFTS